MKINILFTLLLIRFYQAENIKSINFFEKKGTKNLTTPYSIPFLSVLHQNKALHNFYKRGQRPTIGRIKGLD